MSGHFKASKISENVHWVGAIDWTIRDFHGYSTPRGTTYNAYLITGEKNILVDTVKKPYWGEMMSRISSVIDPRKIDIIISNHAEMDHSGSLPETVKFIQPEKVLASVKGVEALSDQLHPDFHIESVADGQKMGFGNIELNFMETRMIHWPDSMFTFMTDDNILFSQDAFGMHYATYERFDYELDDSVLKWEAAKYFANIVMLFAPVIKKIVDKVIQTGWPIRLIAPDHGPIWKRDIGNIIDQYNRWCTHKPTNKAVIVFDTMWNSTSLMARVIGEGIRAGGMKAKLLPLSVLQRADIATEILDSGALLVGSPTLNRLMFPTVADTLNYLKGLKPINLVAGAFGSYGWSGEAATDIQDILKSMGLNMMPEPIKIKYVPDEEALEKCFSWGLDVAAAMKDTCDKERGCDVGRI